MDNIATRSAPLFQVVAAPFRPRGRERVCFEDICAMMEEAAVDYFLPHRLEAVASKRNVVTLALQLPRHLAVPLFADTAAVFSHHPIGDAQYQFACDVARALYRSSSTTHQKCVTAAALCFLHRSRAVARMRQPFITLASLSAMRFEDVHTDDAAPGLRSTPERPLSPFEDEEARDQFLRAVAQADFSLSAMVEMFRQLGRVTAATSLCEEAGLDELRLRLAEQ